MATANDSSVVVDRLASAIMAEIPLSQVLETLPAAVYTADLDGNIILFNRAAVDLWGRCPEPNVDQWCGSLRLFHPDGKPMDHSECPMARALKQKTAIRGEDAILERPDGSRVAFLAYPTPLSNSAGEVVGAVNMMLDISDRKKAEDALRRSEAELSDFVENATIGLHCVGADGRILWANRAELLMLGFESEEYLGRHIADFHADQEVIDDILERLAAGEVLRDYEARLRCKDGSIRHVLIDSSAKFENGELAHTRCFTRNITEQKQAEEEKDLILREMAHRTNNTYAIIQAIAQQSLRHAVSSEHFYETFTGRLQALARANNLTNEARDAIDLRLLAQEQISHLVLDTPERLCIDGESLTLPKSLAIPLGLVFHELGTNAAKYGAFSNDSGNVELSWSTVNGNPGNGVAIVWQERDGPAVTGPSRRGLGSNLIGKAVPGAKVEHRFDADGVVCKVQISLD